MNELLFTIIYYLTLFALGFSIGWNIGKNNLLTLVLFVLDVALIASQSSLKEMLVCQ